MVFQYITHYIIADFIIDVLLLPSYGRFLLLYRVLNTNELLTQWDWSIGLIEEEDTLSRYL